MDKDKGNLSFDFDNDPEFSANFYKNIEKVLEDSDNTETTSKTTAVEAGEPVSAITEEESEPVTATTEEVGVPATAATEEAEKPEAAITEEAEEPEAAITEEAEEPSAAITEEAEVPAAVMADEASNEEIAAASSAAEELPVQEIEDELADINNSLAMQISAEMDILKVQEPSGTKRFFFNLQSGVVLSILCLLGFGFFFGLTKPGNNLLMDMGINIGGIIWDTRTNEFVDNTVVTDDIDYVEDDDIKSSGEEIDPSTIVLPNNSVDGRKEKGIYNILLLGEEAIGQGAGRGRTDEIVIATLNTNDNTVKLTSLMRDQLVRIPGFKDNKLNVAYEEGGIELLYDTIAINFDVHIDGSVLVNFKNFENIVDELGGLEITLTKSEAKYLNSTNYISDPTNRNVVEGTQLMNGNQVLGYSRVRKRAAITGKNNDYGRTDRHRIILDQIFDKCKTKDKAELAALMFKFLPMITSDINNKSFQILLDAYLKTGAKELEQLRIPADGTFDDTKKVRGMSVLIPDYEKNIDILHAFIFGDDTAVSSSSN